MNTFQTVADKVISLIEKDGELIKDEVKQIMLGIGAVTSYNLSDVMKSLNAAVFDGKQLVADIKAAFGLA